MTDQSSLTELERDVVTLAAIANPLPLDVIATVLDLGDAEATETVDRLVEHGVLEVERRGVTAAPIDAPPARRRGRTLVDSGRAAVGSLCGGPRAATRSRRRPARLGAAW